MKKKQTSRTYMSSVKAKEKNPLLGGVVEDRGGSKIKILPYNPKLKSLAKKLRANMTFGEVLLWNQLKKKQIMGFDFDRQRPIDEYIVDFYCKDLMLVIEIDGSSHALDEVKTHDSRRQDRLESIGVRFLRFNDFDIKENMPYVLETLKNWIIVHRDEMVRREEGE